MRSKKLRTLTPDAFALLLYCLDADREQAAVKYEEVRRTLITFFAFRNATDPTALADETLNRVAYRLAEGQEITIDNPLHYFYAVARNVWRETLAQAHHPVAFSELATMPQGRVPSAEELRAELAAQHGQEQRLTCLGRCLHKVPADDRRILLEYHQGQGKEKITRRQVLAAQLGITSGSLRNRTCRIRDRLAACIRACVGEDV